MTLDEMLLEFASNFVTHPHWPSEKNQEILNEAKAAIIAHFKSLVPGYKEIKTLGYFEDEMKASHPVVRGNIVAEGWNAHYEATLEAFEKDSK